MSDWKCVTSFADLVTLVSLSSGHWVEWWFIDSEGQIEYHMITSREQFLHDIEEGWAPKWEDRKIAVLIGDIVGSDGYGMPVTEAAEDACKSAGWKSEVSTR